MARCGAEWGQCRRTKGERAREATPRVENVSVRRGLPSATRPPPTGSRVQVTGQCGRQRSARHRGRARLCPKTYVPRHGARRRASATAQNGASWASPPVEARACCQPKWVASITNPSVFPGARARTCACAALVWAHAPVRECTWGASSLSQPVPAHDPRIPQRGATHTKTGPPRRARVDARDARERTSHGPRSASSASAAAPGGRSFRLGASELARAIAARSHEKSSKIYQPFPTSLPLGGEKKSFRGQKKKVPKFFPPSQPSPLPTQRPRRRATSVGGRGCRSRRGCFLTASNRSRA